MESGIWEMSMKSSIVVVAGIVLISAATSVHSAEEMPFASFKRVPNDKPVIKSGFNEWPMFMADPCVIKDEEGYHAFFTNLFIKRKGHYWYSYDPRNNGDFEIHDSVGTVAYAF